MQMTFMFAQLDDRELMMERISDFLCKQPLFTYSAFCNNEQSGVESQVSGNNSFY